MANKNTDLGAAKTNKKDEFYTELSDIEKELRYYRQHFKGKTVFCNCDDPFESNFFKYFVLNFNRLGLKKLIATSYSTSSIAGTQFNYHIDSNGQMSFTFGGDKKNEPLKKAYKAIITTVYDKTGNDAVEMLDVAELFKSKENELTELKGNGDFRSQECIELLKEADIIVTNPPFSLFREFLSQLMEYEKKFVIIGNMNAIHYKEVFPLLKENKVWIGPSIHSGDRKFYVPDDYPLNASNCGIDETGRRYIRVKGIRWYTNLDIKQRHDELILVKKYDPNLYPKYENYDAINVNSIAEIPFDYEGDMGVPDNFLDNYNPDQFKIVGLGCGNLAKDIGIGKNYRGRTDLAYIKDGKPKCPYSRIIIRNKHPEQSKEA